MSSGEIEGWASERNMRFYAPWPAMRGIFRGGDLLDGGDREVLSGWSGTLGNLPVFGFQAAPGTDTAGSIYVVAVRLPGITFPPLTFMESGLSGVDPAVPIEDLFDLHWSVTARSSRFAKDMVGTAMQEVLIDIQPDFSKIWLERDAILLGARGEVSATAVERYLHLLRRLVDTMPTRVLNAIRQTPAPRPMAPALPIRPLGPPAAAPRTIPAYALPATRPARPVPPAVTSATRSEWAGWAARRGWLHYPNGREIAERFHRGPLPGGRHIDAFAGKFGELPCFGWRTVSGTGPEAKIRQVLCIRKPDMDMEPVRITLDNALLTELIGSGDIEVGDPEFDSRWRVTSDHPDSARAALTPAVWKLMAEPFVPKFAQLWFERDVAAVITERPIGPDVVDDYLAFLHKLVTLMGR